MWSMPSARTTRSPPSGWPDLILDFAVLADYALIDQQGKLALRILGSSPDKFEQLQKTVDALLATERK